MKYVLTTIALTLALAGCSAQGGAPQTLRERCEFSDQLYTMIARPFILAEITENEGTKKAEKLRKADAGVLAALAVCYIAADMDDRAAVNKALADAKAAQNSAS